MLAAGTLCTGLDFASETSSPSGNSNQNTLPPLGFVPFGQRHPGWAVFDCATHQPHDPRGDRQTKAGSFDRSRFVQPLKFLEQTVKAGFADTAAGVSDLNPQSAGRPASRRRNSTLPTSVYFTALPSRLSNT